MGFVLLLLALGALWLIAAAIALQGPPSDEDIDRDAWAIRAARDRWAQEARETKRT